MVHLILGINFDFLGPMIFCFTKLILCNIILKLIINFIIYIERFMNIFIVYVGIIWPYSHFDNTNFKASLVIKIINFNGIKKLAHLAMLVTFYVDVITCQNFNLPHIYHIYAKKLIF
jgi:hypothetical protein